MAQLPSSVAAKAFYNGREYAWRREDVGDAVAAIVSCGYAIDHWEVWLLLEKGVTHFLPPAAPGGPPGVCAAFTPDREPGEAWTQYCARMGRSVLEEIDRVALAKKLPPEVADRIRYNLFYVAEDGRG
jgi:hypothetical protein